MDFPELVYCRGVAGGGNGCEGRGRGGSCGRPPAAQYRAYLGVCCARAQHGRKRPRRLGRPSLVSPLVSRGTGRCAHTSRGRWAGSRGVGLDLRCAVVGGASVYYACHHNPPAYAASLSPTAPASPAGRRGSRRATLSREIRDRVCLSRARRRAARRVSRVSAQRTRHSHSGLRLVRRHGSSLVARSRARRTHTSLLRVCGVSPQIPEIWWGVRYPWRPFFGLEPLKRTRSVFTLLRSRNFLHYITRLADRSRRGRTRRGRARRRARAPRPPRPAIYGAHARAAPRAAAGWHRDFNLYLNLEFQPLGISSRARRGRRAGAACVCVCAGARAPLSRREFSSIDNAWTRRPCRENASTNTRLSLALLLGHPGGLLRRSRLGPQLVRVSPLGRRLAVLAG